MHYRLLHREWRSLKAMWIMFLPELAGTVAVLAIFALAQPDKYRTALWTAGSQLGFNSSPNIVLYAYANYEKVPSIPFVWSQHLTNFNEAISIISLFHMIVKLIGVIMHIWYPIVGLFFNICLVAFYTTSVYGQMGPDYADPQHPSPVAWYIAKPCSVAANQTVQGQCSFAKGSFAATVFMLCVYLTHLGLNIWAMLPTEKDKKGYVPSDDEESVSSFKKSDKTWEMSSTPPTPRTGTLPYTPRTMAFNTLERKLPLRAQTRPI